MSSYMDEIERLASLETFDPRAFSADSKCDQDTCDFVLSLAVAYNDLKNIAMALRFLSEVRPRDLSKPTSEIGQHAGLTLHLIRLEAGVIRELLILIEKDKNILNSPDFNRLKKKLSKKAREAWDAVLSIVSERSTKHPLGKLLLFVRNKVAFHYDPKEVAKGYALVFLQPSSDRIPFVSRGTRMPETRFYFADAAVEKYLLMASDEATVREFVSGRSSLFNDVNLALYEIITKFVNDRGFGWRPIR